MPAESESRVRVEYVRVAMSDGVELCAKLTRPEAAGRFPAIMEYNPYRRLRKPLADYRDEYPPAVPYLAEHGYAVVQFDVRGTGNSGGSTTDIYNERERRDAVEMVEWIAGQDWCSGRVGMIGKSFGAVAQWHVAVEAPGPLKAIIVRSANDDVYTEWVYPGGCLRPYMLDTYSPLMNAYNFAPPDPDIVGNDWEALWRERLEHSRPWGIGYIEHPLHGPYWQDRSLATDYRRVNCAVFVIAGWSDCYPTALLRAYERLDCPKKALVGPWSHYYAEEPGAVPGPRIDTRPLYRRWFDHWLKEIDTGVMDEPPVTLFVRRFSPPNARMPLEEPGAWRNETEWPLARATERILYLAEDDLAGKPDEQPDRDELDYRPGAGVASGIHWGGGILPWGMPLDQRLDDPWSLVYTSPPLDDELEVTGTPAAVLFVSSTADVAYFRVKLIDVAPDGTAKLVRYGGLNATHRDSHFEPEPLVPGTVYELTVPLKAVSYVFEPGHRIRIAIAGADFQNAWPTGIAAVHSIHRGGNHPSRIVLPVVPAQMPVLSAPDMVALPPASPDDLVRPLDHSVVTNLVNSSTAVALHTQNVIDDDRIDITSEFTVDNTTPSNATLDANARYRVRRAEYDVEIQSEERTVSSAEGFRHTVRIQVIRDGNPYFDREWDVSVPRALN